MYLSIVQLSEFTLFNSYHHHVPFFVLKTGLLLLFIKPSATFFSFFNGQYVASIVVEVHAFDTLSHAPVFLVGFVIYSIEFEVLLGINADGADDTVLDVLEFVETNLFTYSFISLIEWNEEFHRQIQLVLYVIV